MAGDEEHGETLRMTASMANSKPKHQRLSQQALPAVNAVVADSIYAWGLTDRLYRLSVPAYQYSPSDWIDHQFYGVFDGELSAVLVLTEQASVAPNLGKITLIHGLYINQAHQGLGLGRGLIETAMQWGQAHDTTGLYVKAHATAVPFFHHLGFQPLPIEDPEREYPHRLWRPF